jgi:hypothetical protein
VKRLHNLDSFDSILGDHIKGISHIWDKLRQRYSIYKILQRSRRIEIAWGSNVLRKCDANTDYIYIKNEIVGAHWKWGGVNMANECTGLVKAEKFFKQKKNQWYESASKAYRPSDRRLSGNWLPTFADRGCHVVSVTDPYGRILGFLDRRRYLSIK